VEEMILLHRPKGFIGKYTPREMYSLHPRPDQHIFNILTSEDSDDLISQFFMVVCTNSQFVFIIKRKLQVGLRYEFIFL